MSARKEKSRRVTQQTKTARTTSKDSQALHKRAGCNKSTRHSCRHCKSKHTRCDDRDPCGQCEKLRIHCQRAWRWVYSRSMKNVSDVSRTPLTPPRPNTISSKSSSDQSALSDCIVIENDAHTSHDANSLFGDDHLIFEDIGPGIQTNAQNNGQRHPTEQNLSGLGTESIPTPDLPLESCNPATSCYRGPIHVTCRGDESLLPALDTTFHRFAQDDTSNLLKRPQAVEIVHDTMQDVLGGQIMNFGFCGFNFGTSDFNTSWQAEAIRNWGMPYEVQRYLSFEDESSMQSIVPQIDETWLVPQHTEKPNDSSCRSAEGLDDSTGGTQFSGVYSSFAGMPPILRNELDKRYLDEGKSSTCKQAVLIALAKPIDGSDDIGELSFVKFCKNLLL